MLSCEMHAALNLKVTANVTALGVETAQTKWNSSHVSDLGCNVR